MYLICPRPCASPFTIHCFGTMHRGRVRCHYCGRFMPLDELIDLPDEF